jgi:hypothetical protein
LGLLALAILTLAGCYLPPFDEKLSETEHFAAGLNHVARLGPFYIDDGKYENGYFLPSRGGTSPTDGYWIRRNDKELLAAYMSGSKVYENNSTSANALADGFVAFPLTEDETKTLSAALSDRGIITIFGNEASSGILALGTDASYGLKQTMDPLDFSSAPSGNIVGASYRIEASAKDRVSILYQSTSSPPEFGGGSVPITSSEDWTTAISITPATDSSHTLPSFKPGAFFGYCLSNDRYYFSGYKKDNSGIYTAYWLNTLSSTPAVLPSMEARIAAILSTDRLLAIGDGTMYLYNLDGALVTSYATGSMRFAYEYCDSSDGVWYCYFTRAVRVKKDGGSGEVTIDVYRCRSDALGSLGN